MPLLPYVSGSSDQDGYRSIEEKRMASRSIDQRRLSHLNSSQPVSPSHIEVQKKERKKVKGKKCTPYKDKRKKIHKPQARARLSFSDPGTLNFHGAPFTLQGRLRLYSSPMHSAQLQPERAGIDFRSKGCATGRDETGAGSRAVSFQSCMRF
jgi:hypothetical protein